MGKADFRSFTSGSQLSNAVPLDDHDDNEEELKVKLIDIPNCVDQ